MCSIYRLWLVSSGLWFQLREVSVQANVVPQYTEECLTGTEEVYMPDPEAGKCYCGNTALDPQLGYAEGFCTPYPPDEGLSAAFCKPGDEDFGGRCQYYCECRAKQINPADTGIFRCCKPRDDQALVNKVVIAAPTPKPTLPPDRWTPPPVRILTTTTSTTD